MSQRDIQRGINDLRLDRCFYFVKNGQIFRIIWEKKNLRMYPLRFQQDKSKYSPEQH
jgi:hypothetical protein